MQTRFTFHSRLLVGCLVVVVCTLIFVAVVLQRSLRVEMVEQLQADMSQQLLLIGEIVKDRYKKNDGLAGGDALADQLGNKLGSRVTLINHNGVVVGDSGIPLAKVAEMDNHALRPEVVDSLDKEVGFIIRYSATLETDLMYAASRIKKGTDEGMTIRLAVPLSNVKKALSRLQGLIVGATLLGALLSLGMAYLVARSFSRPIKEMTAVATEIAGGDLKKRFRRYPGHEIGDLGRAFDRMADNLQARIDDITEGRDRLEAVLRGMAEGVMVLDRDGNVIVANKALQVLMDIPTSPVGWQITEFLRNAEILDALKKVREGALHATTEVRTLGRIPRFLEVHMVRLPDLAPQAGVVVVFHDLTERKRVEEIRRDFVANVSHELRTPLTAIRGSAETLLGGALDSPQYAKHFAEMISRNAIRLERLAQDLLELATMESGEQAMETEEISGANLADSALATVGELADEQGVELDLRMPNEDLVLRGSRRHLEQAVINLLDNAIKYTDRGGTVRLSISKHANEVHIKVSDTGIGIAEDHLQRIFERFYRIDKNRSRALGGTGLGLAIVKHTAQNHGGRVDVESVPGRGTTFTLTLPA